MKNKFHINNLVYYVLRDQKSVIINWGIIKHIEFQPLAPDETPCYAIGNTVVDESEIFITEAEAIDFATTIKMPNE